MHKYKHVAYFLLTTTFIALFHADKAFSLGPIIDFDKFPVTGPKEYPGNSTDGLWKYTSGKNDTFATFKGSCGFWNTKEIDAFPGNYEYMNLYKNDYNSSAMGWTAYAFFEIDDKVSIKGNSLKITVTGGVTSAGTHGSPLFNKEEYLDYVESGKDPVAHDGVRLTSDARIYFMNETYNNANYPLRTAKGANTFSFYVYLPEGLSNKSDAPNPSDLKHNDTMHTGPFNGIGGHWYHSYLNSGGGWIHVNQGTHPRHNNAFSDASKYPYPSYSVRSYGVDYYSNMYAIYLALGSYSPGAIPLYNIWFDEPTFLYDDYPQNHETINSIAVGYYPHKDFLFEMSFHDKYTGNAYASSTYEIRYSFSQITNDNWHSATPVMVQADSYYGIPARTDGIMKKVNSSRQQVWVPFKLASATDEALLTPGKTIFFAVKDVSQDPNNLQLINPVHNRGRQYAKYPNTFDFEGDAPALPLIKRIDFFISEGNNTQLIKAPSILLIK
jgi:hypothetical protein